METNNKHYLFPTLVLEGFYDKHETFLNIFYNSWSDHYSDGYSHEGTGDLDLHLDDRYSDLYRFLSNQVKEYLKTAGVDYEKFDINFVKSWLNALSKTKTPPHSHKDAHLSIVYYVSTPPESEQVLRFHYNEYDREPFNGLYTVNSIMSTEFNSRFYTVKTTQGQSLVFPSRLIHDTYSFNSDVYDYETPVFNTQDLKSKRICIASDVILTFKNKTNKPLGLQPIENWRRFQ